MGEKGREREREWDRGSLKGTRPHPVGSSDCNPGIPNPGRFSNPEIPGFSHPQSRDFGIITRKPS